MAQAIKRSIATAVALGALGTTGLSAPVQASPAGGGSYASSVATLTSTGVVTGDNKVTAVARIWSTSSAVKYMHGTVTLKIIRSSDQRTFLNVTKTVAGSSARSYWTTVPLPRDHRWYRVYATYKPTSGHIEKGSSRYRAFKY